MVSISDDKGKQIMSSDSEDSEDDDLSPSPHQRIIRALVVHHDDCIGKVHEVMLNRLGVETRLVKTSQEAIKLICVEEVYDLILLGRYLPVIDGVQMTKMLRDMDYPTTIVGVTRFLTELQREEFFSAGLDGCIDNKTPLTDTTLAFIVESIPRRQTWKKKICIVQFTNVFAILVFLLVLVQSLLLPRFLKKIKQHASAWPFQDDTFKLYK